MNPMILLPKLAADLKAAAVQFVERGFDTVEDVAALDEPVIVNCTGLGAKALFGDDALVPQRGHLVVLERTDPKQDYFFSGGCANPSVCYVFCRQGDIVVGGTVVSGDANATATPADAAVFARVLANAKKVFGGDVSSCR